MGVDFLMVLAWFSVALVGVAVGLAALWVTKRRMAVLESAAPDQQVSLLRR